MRKNRLIIQFIFILSGAYTFGINKVMSDDSLKFKKVKPEYAITALEGINTNQSEFSAVTFSNNLIFVANQPKDLINHESVDVNGIPYTDVFAAEIKNNNIGKATSFSAKINGPYHDGPVSFNNEQTQLYLTRAEYLHKGNRNFVNKAKILVFDKKGNNWSGPVAFKYNSDLYSTGHASVSKDGQYLFFTSDMPGGKGGKDIYVCKKEENGWGKPENLGSGINTIGDEEFPYIRQDGTLFFSSNGYKGYGGFDIYSAERFGEKWYLKRNEGADINSGGDDFGIMFTDSIHGYFSSNRKGGTGLDDIYQFTFTERNNNILATLLLSKNLNDPSKNTPVFLLNDKGEIVDSTRTNHKGFFQFRDLENEKQFMASVESGDIEFKRKENYYLANEKGQIVRTSKAFNNRDFVFDQLPFDQNTLPDVYAEEDLTLSGMLSYRNDKSSFVKNVQLFLMNEAGNVVDSIRTGEDGSFRFEKLLPEKDYMVLINESDLNLPAGTVVDLRDKNGKHLKNFVTAKDAFNFKLLAHEKKALSESSPDEELSFKTCAYDKARLILKPVSDEKIYLFNNKGMITDSAITNPKGFFKFNNLVIDKEYLAALAEDDLQFSKKTIYYLVDAKGTIVKTSNPFKNKKFVFNNIPFDSLSLQESVIGDDNLWAGGLHFGPLGAEPIKNTRMYLRDAAGKITDSTITNESGCFAFRNSLPQQEQTLNINEKDMHLPFNTKVILTDKDGNVVKVFYTGKDAFDYKVLSAEKNLMSDSENIDEVNMKFNGYVYNKQKKGLAGATMMLFDEKGNQLEKIETAKDGRFSFRGNNMNLADRVEIISENKNDSILFMADNKGKIYKQLKRNQNGTFGYRLLEVDKQIIGDLSIDDPWLQEVAMKSIKNVPAVTESIFYSVNDFKINMEGQKILDKMVNILKTNPKLSMELNSYADSRYSEYYNLKLSNKRAQYAMDYIISKGIDGKRLKATGFGETRLSNKCTDGVDCSENEHAVNRRTDLKINYSK